LNRREQQPATPAKARPPSGIFRSLGESSPQTRNPSENVPLGQDLLDDSEPGDAAHLVDLLARLAQARWLKRPGARALRDGAREEAGALQHLHVSRDAVEREIEPA
jgi:hypothetical protein